MSKSSLMPAITSVPPPLDDSDLTRDLPSLASIEDELRLSKIHSVSRHQKPRPFTPSKLYDQPLKGLICTYWITTCLFLSPYWYVEPLFTERPRRSWSLATCVRVAFIRRITRLIPLTGFHTGGRDLSVVPRSLKFSEHVWIDPVPPHYIKDFVKKAAGINAVAAERVAAFWYPAAPTETDRRGGTRSSGDVVLAFHGGAYILGTAHESDFVANIFKGLLTAGYSHVLGVDYRLAIKNPFPSQILDALAAYSYLVEILHIPPARITVCGDSAGANLALALCRYVRDTGLLPLPGHLLLLSPWCDPTFSYRHIEGSFRANYRSDIVNIDVTPTAVKFYMGVLPDGALHSPLISPITSPETRVFKNVDGIFARFPRTLIVISKGERLWDEAQELLARMTGCRVEVSMHAEDDAVHDWMQFSFSGQATVRTLEAIGHWRDERSVPSKHDT